MFYHLAAALSLSFYRRQRETLQSRQLLALNLLPQHLNLESAGLETNTPH
jgi:hypothetical protein